MGRASAAGIGHVAGPGATPLRAPVSPGSRSPFPELGLPEPVDGLPEPVEGLPEPVERFPELVDGLPELVEGFPELVDGFPELVEGPVGASPQFGQKGLTHG